ncbi:ATP-dependent DNA ligase [Candidatus Dependentiae bacterium]|nr:ATP-dependent DNA ligase [Candidatus Dependentiae bacterium]
MELKKYLSKKEQKKLNKKNMPKWTNVMLAKLEHDLFFNKSWIYERKLDGERCLAFKHGKTVRLRSRNNKSLNTSYPEIQKAISSISYNNIIVDGEVVAFDDNVTSFSKLQPRMHVGSKDKAIATGIHVYYYIFDILYFDKFDVTKLSLLTRKNILKKALKFKDPLRYSTHRINNTKQYFNQACKKGWEGLMVKKIDSIYVHKRSSDWKKFKCVKEQELVVGGYTEPQGERQSFGALLVGYYKNGKLKYAGKVGTGYTQETLKMLGKKLRDLKINKNPFDSDEPKLKNGNFVKPKLVVEVGFTEWTKDNKLRHPRYLGLRRDKDAKKVKQEK